MNYFVHMHTIMLVTTSFAQLAILYVYLYQVLLEKASELTFFLNISFRLIFYLSQMKLVTTKMGRMHAKRVKYL